MKPFMSLFKRILISSQIFCGVVGLSRSQVRSTLDTSMVGTRRAVPKSEPFSSWATLATNVAAPVVQGRRSPQETAGTRTSKNNGTGRTGCAFGSVLCNSKELRPIHVWAAMESHNLFRLNFRILEAPTGPPLSELVARAAVNGRAMMPEAEDTEYQAVVQLITPRRANTAAGATRQDPCAATVLRIPDACSAARQADFDKDSL